MELAQLSNDRKAEHHKSQCDVLLGILFVERNIKFGNIKIYESLAQLSNDGISGQGWSPVLWGY